MYLFLITFGLCVAYLILFFVFPVFFGSRPAKMRYRSFYSLAIIIACSFLITIVSLSITDREISNRVLHAFGGGFLAFVVCFLAAKDSKVSITKFQFFVFSVLIVTALGVANEIIEFFFQHYLGLIFAPSVEDTWLDLISNSVGALIGSVCFVPFVKKENSDH